MQSKGQTAAKVIGVILVLALLAGIVAVIHRFTNGFNEDFKTFYVECNGEQILTTNSEMHSYPAIRTALTSSTPSTREIPSRRTTTSKLYRTPHATSISRWTANATSIPKRMT